MEPPRKRARRSPPEQSNVDDNDGYDAANSLKPIGSLKRHMYLTFVNNALLEKYKGRPEPYEELVSQFSQASRGTSSESDAAIGQLRSWLDALSHVVSRLDRLHASLVEAILSLPWSTADDTFVKSYTSFIGLLVSARPEYLGAVLDRSVKGLTYTSALRAVDASIQDSSTPMTRRMVYDREHGLLTHLLFLIPTLPASLIPTLTKHFPHKREPKVAQVTYIRNLLRVSEYCPHLAGRIISLVVERAVMIDVEVQIAYEDLEAGVEGGDSDALFDLDPFDLVLGNSPPDSDDEDEGQDEGGTDLDEISSEGGDASDGGKGDEKPTEDAIKHTAIRKMVTKLDTILKQLFEHFERIGARPSDVATSMSTATVTDATRGSPEERVSRLRPQFLHLLTIFDRTILPTFRTRYTQFLLFYFTSIDASFADLFQGLLLSKALFEADQSTIVRLASVSYIAGFVSRANCVSRESCRRVVVLLCEYLARKLDSEEVDKADGQTEVFYAIAQAIMVIFCFRWRDLREERSDETDDEEHAGDNEGTRRTWMPELSVMQRAVTSPLNPLRYCFKHVVQQFAAVASHTNFLYCHSIIEANRRAFPDSSDTPRADRTARADAIIAVKLASTTHLANFFPFDPYTLPETERYIEGLYRTWADVRPDGFEDEEEEEEDSEDDEEEDDEEQSRRRLEELHIAPFNEARRLDMPSSSWPTLSGDDVEQEADILGASFGGLSISPERHMQPARSASPVDV